MNQLRVNHALYRIHATSHFQLGIPFCVNPSNRLFSSYEWKLTDNKDWLIDKAQKQQSHKKNISS